MGELIAEVINVPRPNFPAESGADSYFNGDVETVSPVVSDALDAHGHSITVRDSEFKYITRELTETADTDAVHTLPDNRFDVLTDRGERELLNRESSPDALIERATSAANSPSELGRVESEFSRTVERQLEQQDVSLYSKPEYIECKMNMDFSKLLLFSNQLPSMSKY